jgi:hypothetical protein
MRHSLIGFLLAALIGCESSVAPSDSVTADNQSGQVSLRTDRASYSAMPIGGEGSYRTYGFTLVAQFTNGMSRTVYLERCYPTTPYPVYGIGSDADGQSAAYNPTWGCVGHDSPIVVLPGMTRTDSLRILGPNAWDGRTNEPFGNLTGRFRLSYVVATCRAVSGCELPGHPRESNDFEVRLGL